MAAADSARVLVKRCTSVSGIVSERARGCPGIRTHSDVTYSIRGLRHRGNPLCEPQARLCKVAFVQSPTANVVDSRVTGARHASSTGPSPRCGEEREQMLTVPRLGALVGALAITAL